jgi:thioredoxin reductase (NADPH)
MSKPILFVLDEHLAELEELKQDLSRRFEADYRVIGESSASVALDALASLAGTPERVALLIADHDMTEMSGVSFLTLAHNMHAEAKRVLLVDRVYTSANPVVEAMTLGLIDHHLSKPWKPRERSLYPAVTEFLAGWTKSTGESFEVMRIVGRDGGTRSHELRDRMTRVGLPFSFYTEESEEGRELLAEVGEDGTRLPVVVFFDGRVLVDPTHAHLTEALGAKTHTDTDTCDVAILGAGPAGLAAAVYASSEGLRTLVVEPDVFGGQAGTSSLIRNYLGFNRGISGDDLAYRAFEQAWLFGADFVFAQEATRIEPDDQGLIVELSDGTSLHAAAVVVATGVTWRRLNIPGVESLRGSGVFYGAAGSEAQAMRNREVFVVGAGNSAGQAAMHLSEYAKNVYVLVRGDDLAGSMSTYLIEQITGRRNIHVCVQTEVIGAGGRGRLETLSLRDNQAGKTEEVSADALFVLIGAEPHTQWVNGSIQQDARGFLLTGTEVIASAESSTRWPLKRSPLHLETSIPGVFAAGDVRHGSTKRVASAVGEGATAIQMVHVYLQERMKN